MKNFLQLVLSVPAVSLAVLVFVATRKDGLLDLLGLHEEGKLDCYLIKLAEGVDHQCGSQSRRRE
jgi:hypothetical protein